MQYKSLCVCGSHLGTCRIRNSEKRDGANCNVPEGLTSRTSVTRGGGEYGLTNFEGLSEEDHGDRGCREQEETEIWVKGCG